MGTAPSLPSDTPQASGSTVRVPESHQERIAIILQFKEAETAAWDARDQEEQYRNELRELQFSLSCDVHDLERRADSDPQVLHALRRSLSGVNATLAQQPLPTAPWARQVDERWAVAATARQAAPLTGRAAGAASMSMAVAGTWNNNLLCTAPYLASRAQPCLPQQFLEDVAAAEAAVAGMSWDAVVAQPTTQAGGLHFVVHGSAVFLYLAAAGEVRAQCAARIPPPVS